MNTQNDRARLVVNPFLIYIAFGLCALFLQKLLPLPFILQSSARIIGMTIMIVNLIIGLPAVRNMFAAKTSPNPSRLRPRWFSPDLIVFRATQCILV